jgi:hypothetical protein
LDYQSRIEYSMEIMCHAQDRVITQGENIAVTVTTVQKTNKGSEYNKGTVTATVHAVTANGISPDTAIETEFFITPGQEWQLGGGRIAPGRYCLKFTYGDCVEYLQFVVEEVSN